MEPQYVLITILFDGRVRTSRVTSPEVPEFSTPPGGVSFVVHVTDYVGRHGHEAPFPSNQHTITEGY